MPKKISAKKLLIGVGILLACVLALYMIRSGHRGGEVLRVLSDEVDLRIKDFHYTEVGDSDLTWEINADTATYMKKDNITLFENVKIRLIFSNGDVYVITGEKGSLHTDTNDMEIRGNVVASSDEGERFETAVLYYTHRGGDGLIHTKDPVRMLRPGTDVRGVGMNLSFKRKKATLLSRVRATIDLGQRGEAE
ncbi:MAG: LPS export ABC transporter periplasmic protein LptC [Deltaproteobacteria bacterium]|nr:LPS export ABC transporter periplasmic protein LptC [Deltaproteobacteria bacterium]